MTLPKDPFRRTNRFDEIVYGILFLVLATFCGFFGFRGAYLYLGGSREAPADPLYWGLAIVAAVVLILLAWRLFSGRHRAGSFLPNVVLLVFGLGAIAGAIWFFQLNRELHGSIADASPGFLAATAGGAALVQWWRRTHSGEPKA